MQVESNTLDYIVIKLVQYSSVVSGNGSDKLILGIDIDYF